MPQQALKEPLGRWQQHLRQKNVCKSCQLHYSTAVALLLHYQTSDHESGAKEAMTKLPQDPGAAHQPSTVLTMESQTIAETMDIQPSVSTPSSLSHSSPCHNGVLNGDGSVVRGAMAQHALNQRAVNPPQVQPTVTDSSQISCLICAPESVHVHIQWLREPRACQDVSFGRSE